MSLGRLGRLQVNGQTISFEDFQITPEFVDVLVDVTNHNDPCRRYIAGIPDGLAITFNMNYMTRDEVRALERQKQSRCPYCGRKCRFDGMGQCVGCGAPE